MPQDPKLNRLLNAILRREPMERQRATATGITNVGGVAMPSFGEAAVQPKKIELTTVQHPDGRMSQYPPASEWDDWVEWDGRLWPKKVARRYMLVPTICFNCESACGLLAYID
ncbi:MAG: hypothetical protein KDE31_02090, partial [Caldilineaceae bacterium]|nr:hypothetical protein [Caldilineaceae bacterium]